MPFLGSYFARDAQYSDGYTDEDGTQSMFVCRVLVGDFTLGHPDYNMPPLKDGQTIAFDSCVDNLENPSLFVVFEKNQIYPEYLIKYEDDVGPEQEVAVPPAVPDPDHNCTDNCYRCLYYFLCCCCDDDDEE